MAACVGRWWGLLNRCHSNERAVRARAAGKRACSRRADCRRGPPLQAVVRDRRCAGRERRDLELAEEAKARGLCLCSELNVNMCSEPPSDPYTFLFVSIYFLEQQERPQTGRLVTYLEDSKRILSRGSGSASAAASSADDAKARGRFFCVQS